MQAFSKSKRILLIGGNYYPEPTGIGRFNGEMVQLLASEGYQCTVITSYPYYPFWKVQEPYLNKAKWYTKEIINVENAPGNPINVYRCPQYVPSVPSGKKRILLDLSFCFFSFFQLISILFHKRYDYVITVVPCFQVGILGWLYKKIRGGQFLYHIQDLQIDAAHELKMIKSDRLIRILFSCERFLLKKADIVSSISEGMVKKIISKCPREVVLFPNWTDTALFYPIKEKAFLKEVFGFSANDYIILYSGAMGEKQGLDQIIYAAKALSHFKNMKFIICGAGPYKAKLEELGRREDVNNVLFLPLQPSGKLNQFLNMPDIHLILQKSSTTDLVMPSKLSNILAVGGTAIISANKNSTLFDQIQKNKLGYVVDPDSVTNLIEAIIEIYFSRNIDCGSNARKYAEDQLSADKVLKRYFDQV